MKYYNNAGVLTFCLFFTNIGDSYFTNSFSIFIISIILTFHYKDFQDLQPKANIFEIEGLY